MGVWMWMHSYLNPSLHPSPHTHTHTHTHTHSLGRPRRDLPRAHHPLPSRRRGALPNRPATSRLHSKQGCQGEFVHTYTHTHSHSHTHTHTYTHRLRRVVHLQAHPEVSWLSKDIHTHTHTHVQLILSLTHVHSHTHTHTHTHRSSFPRPARIS